MTMEPSLQQASAPPPAPCWSNIVKQQLQSPSPSQHQPAKQQNLANQELLLDSCKSAHGISMAVIDANAVIQGGEKLHNLADKFVTVPEVMAEIRDPVSRHRLSLIPFSIDSIEPTPESLNKVIKFARATGDLQTLSDVDLKLIALTYTLEAQLHGTQHLRDAPPPVHTINVKRFPEKDLPGWGSNVPNLEEWEALEQEAGDGSDKFNSKILPLKDINLNIVQLENQAEDGSVGTREEANSENQDIEACLRGPRRYPPKKTVVKIEGKKMVADGVDASQGQLDDVAGDWMPAVSRSTHRRFLRRKGRREQCSELAEKEIQQDLEPSMDNNNVNEAIVSDEALDHTSEAVGAGNGMPEGNEMAEVTSENEDLSSILKHIRVEEGSRITLQEAEESTISTEIYIDDSASREASCGYNADIVAEDVDIDSASASAELDHLEISSQTHESVDASYTDDIDSEHSLMLRSLSESSVACVTSDFAMQNVLLQMGLRLLAPGGNQIRQLHRWILKCHACYTVTAEIGRIFCPKCGNGGTLRKVAVTVGENGITLAARRPRITLRGTKFSLPTPQGGRNAIFKNLILREDQLPQKLLYPKTKKKAIKEGDDFVPGDIFSFTHHTDKKAPYRAPVRQALAVFSGKRNPNDNHYSRSKH